MSKAITLDLFNELSAVAAPAIWEVSMHESAAAYDVVAAALGNRWRADQLRRAKLNAALVTVRSGRSVLRVRAVAERVAELREALKKCHRKQAQKAVLRSYPKFTPGMSTAEYVAKFSAANGAANVLPFDLSQYTAPCALYENGALDFDVIEEQIEESAAVQEVAESPEVAEFDNQTPASSVESIGAMEEGAFLLIQVFPTRAAAIQEGEQIGGCYTVEPINGAGRFGPHRLAIQRKLADTTDGRVAGTQDKVANAMAPAPAETGQVSPAFAALIRAAREAKRLARQAIAQASASSAQSVPDDADGNPYPYLPPISDTHSGGVAAAKNIRLVLKNQFPGVKFKVTSDYSSVNVRWIDGPVTGAVEDALAPFDIGRSDSQSDYFYTERTRFSEKFGGVQYLFTHRELSESKIVASINAVFGEDGPTFAEWEAGTPWAQVARKGSFRDAQMWDEYEWLAMVRRDANEK